VSVVSVTERRISFDRRTVTRQTPDRRRGRPQHVPMTLQAFAALQRNITLRELSDVSSVSSDKLLTMIPDHLDAFRPAGFNHYLVTHAEASRFLRDLRLIP
jgi:hypothetical protein